MLISLVTGLFLLFEKGFSVRGYFFQEDGTFCLLARRLLIPGFSIPQIASIFTKNAHYRDHRVTLLVFAVSIAISSALVLSLGAVAATLFRWGSVDK
jgi:hypothetical protein